MASDLHFPEALSTRVRHFLTPESGFPGWDAYVAGKNGWLDPIVWLGTQPDTQSKVLTWAFAEHKKPWVPLSNHSCHSAAVLVYLRWLKHRQLCRDSIMEAVEPVPYAIVGHVLVFVSCLPTDELPADFPKPIGATIWTTVDDYLRILDDFRERVRDLWSAAEKGFPEVKPMPASLDNLRAVLHWVVSLPTLMPRDVSAVEFILSLPDADLTPGRLSGDIAASLESVRGPVKLPLLPATSVRVPHELLRKQMGRSSATELGLLPYIQTRNHIFLIAARPHDHKIHDEIARSFPGKTPIISVGAADSISFVLSEFSRAAATAPTATKTHAEDLAGIALHIDPASFTGKDPRSFPQFEQIFQFILSDATQARAADIHVDIFCGMTRIRFGIDGGLVTVHSWHRDFAGRIANWLRDKYCKRTAAAASPAAPQEGSFTYAFLGRPIMCRIALGYCNAATAKATQPKIVMRILDRDNGVRDLAVLGLWKDELASIRSQIRRKKGIFIVAGPTGGGKTTTLMACLSDINTPDRALYSFEDPVEYVIPGIAQFAAASKEAEASAERLTMAANLRLGLRMAPNVILVGEIRDHETAETAIEASNTGHMIFGTIHANSALGILTRLQKLEIDSIMIGDNVRILAYQELARKLCTCSRRIPMSDRDRKLFDDEGIEHEGWVPAPVGCPRCRNVGYHGRVVVIEVLRITQPVADLIAEGAPLAKIREHLATCQGGENPAYISLRRSILRRVTTEQTSMAEALRILDLGI